MHIAKISDNIFNGVCVVVPRHVKAQQHNATVGFINVNNYYVPSLSGQLEYKEPFSLSDLPSPYNKPDLVVFNELYVPQYIKMYKELRKNGIPYIIVPHGEMTIQSQKKKRLKKIAANLLLFNAFVKHALAIQCLSQRESDAIRFKQRRIIVTNGMSIPEQRKSVFCKNGGVRFVYIGRLEVQIKGLDLMIKAVANCKQFLVDHGCTFAIFGPDYKGRYARVEQLIKENNVGDIISLNHEVRGDEKIRELLAGDCFIQTSRTEAMPMGILESLSYGVPCFVTKGTSMADFIKNNNAGWAADTDVQAITHGIMQVIDERETFAVKSDNAIATIRQNFNWETIASSAIEKYKQLIDKE